MKKILLILLVILFPPFATARNISEIKNSGKFYVATLNPKKDEFGIDKSIEKNKLIKKFFETYSLKVYKKKISLEFVYVNTFSEFWTDETGKIKKDAIYNPSLFKNVDAYFEFMSMSNWRTLKASPIPIFKSNLSLVCNFMPNNIDIHSHSIQQVMDIMNNKSIHFIAIKNTKLDNSLERLKIPQERIKYVNSRYGLVEGMLKKKNKECTLAETILVLNMLTKGKIYFIGHITPYKNREMAWWVKKDNAQLIEFVKKLIPELKKSDEWEHIFKTLFGINFTLYDFIVHSSIDE